MGRKSRRNNGNDAPVAALRETLYPTAIYARLSNKKRGKDDNGTSIENQVAVCKEYIREDPDLQLVKVFTDYGWTGTNMKRPAFEELMDEVRAGKINTIVVRDLSRFGRNYIETGIYLEKIFPKLDVRFVAVKEKLDTLKVDGTNESLMVPLQNLINDLYSKDISRKIHATYQVQKEEKSFAWRIVPYGYMWDEEHTRIVPENGSSDVVRQIFQWKLEGIGNQAIAEMLNGRGIKTSFTDRRGKNHRWIEPTIRYILRNPAYIGNKVWGRRKKELYKGLGMIYTPEEEWAVVEDDHEPLVSHEVFKKVQGLLDEAKEKRRKSIEENRELHLSCEKLLDGKVICGDCGKNMLCISDIFKRKDGSPYTYVYYYCRRTVKGPACSYHSISQIKLEKKILRVIQTQTALALSYEKLLEELKKSKDGITLRRHFSERVTRIKGKIRSVQARRERLYEDYTDGILSAEEYSYAKERFNSDYERLNRLLETAVAQQTEYCETVSSENKWIQMMKSIGRADHLNRELVDEVLDKVLVFKERAIEVVLKYQDVFELTKKYLNLEEGGQKYE